MNNFSFFVIYVCFFSLFIAWESGAAVRSGDSVKIGIHRTIATQWVLSEGYFYNNSHSSEIVFIVAHPWKEKLEIDTPVYDENGIKVGKVVLSHNDYPISIVRPHNPTDKIEYKFSHYQRFTFGSFFSQPTEKEPYVIGDAKGKEHKISSFRKNEVCQLKGALSVPKTVLVYPENKILNPRNIAGALVREGRLGNMASGIVIGVSRDDDSLCVAQLTWIADQDLWRIDSF